MNPRSLACGAVTTSLVAGAFVFGAPTVANAAGNPITFAAATAVSSGGNPIAVANGDMDGDGDQDVVVASVDDDQLEIYLNDGTGALTAGPTQDALGLDDKLYVQRLSTADFNGDGFDDVVLGYYDSDGEINVFMNDGAGNLLPGTAFTVAEAGYPDLVATADFNNDGNMDITTGNWYRSVSVLLGNGTGGFPSIDEYAMDGVNFNSGTSSIATGDFSGDGLPDIAISAYPLQAAFLTNNGDGTFTISQRSPSSPPGMGTIARGAVLRDIDSDGSLDFVTATAENQIVAWMNDGTGTFADPSVAAATSAGSNRGLASTDFNGDGIADLVAGNSSASAVDVLAGNGDGSFETPTTPSTGAMEAPGSVQTADMNGDCRPDVVTGGVNSSNAGVLLNTSEWPAVAAITNSPNAGPKAGGNTVEILGTGLDSSCEVTVNGTKVPFTVIDGGKLRIVMPAGTGTVNIRVKNGRGDAEQSYRYEGAEPPPPTPTREIVTISAGNVKGSGKKKTVKLTGETRGKKKKVYIYRAATRKGSAQLIAVRTSKNHMYQVAKASLGGHSSAFFCARVGSHFSDTVRVPTGPKSALGVRGDIVRCK